MELDKLIIAIENAKTIDEIVKAKVDFGYSKIVKRVNEASNKKRKEIEIIEHRERRVKNASNRKKLLMGYVGENIYYIGSTYKSLYRNRPCKLLKINRTKCLVEFSGKDGQWNIPIMELHPQKTNAKEMILTDKGIKII